MRIGFWVFLISSTVLADTWLNGSSRQTEFPLETKYFTGQFIFDGNYVRDFAQPVDHTLSGSTNSGRTSEFQVQQLGVGGDFHYQNVRARLMTQIGMYSMMTPRNDSSPSRGQWDLADAYRYISEAYAGYHFDVWDGINVDAGIFMSYIGLCSYYNYENWVYQMSYVSANTPFFFNGVRAQAFLTEKFKLELWLINGWQSYGMFNEMPGLGLQFLWRPNDNWYVVTNNYFGFDTINNPSRARLHSDNSVQHRYYDASSSVGLSQAAFSLTGDLGCENGGGAFCGSQYFLGVMAYNRLWFFKNRFGLTIGAGAIKNPSRYLVLLPPINGATATTGSQYFSANLTDDFMAWDVSVTADYMPSEFLTLRAEYIHRSASTPYFAAHGGMSSNNGAAPNLSTFENRINVALLVRF